MNTCRVTAYNVEVSQNATAEQIGLALLPYRPDIAAFSEAQAGGWTEEVASVLGLPHVVVGQYTTAGHTNKYKSVASRTELTRYEEVLMADTEHTATRAVTLVGEQEIVVYSIHFPFGWRDQSHIDETTHKIETFVRYLSERQESETAIVMGDFNFIPSREGYRSPYYEMFVDIGLDTSWKQLGLDIATEHTCSTFRPEDVGSGKVIDHIIYDHQRLHAIDGGIIELDPPLSDHKPIWAELEIVV